MRNDVTVKMIMSNRNEEEGELPAAVAVADAVAAAVASVASAALSEASVAL